MPTETDGAAPSSGASRPSATRAARRCWPPSSSATSLSWPGCRTSPWPTRRSSWIDAGDERVRDQGRCRWPRGHRPLRRSTKATMSCAPAARPRPYDVPEGFEDAPWRYDFGDHRDFDGVRIPASVVATYDLPDDPWEYLRAEITEHRALPRPTESIGPCANRARGRTLAGRDEADRLTVPIGMRLLVACSSRPLWSQCCGCPAGAPGLWALAARRAAPGRRWAFAAGVPV